MEPVLVEMVINSWSINCFPSALITPAQTIYYIFLKEYPLKSDLVEKWSDVEGLWNYVLSTLMCIQDNPDFPVLISQPALSPKKNTEKIAEVSSSNVDCRLFQCNTRI